ncbi:hypothetical protein EI94DRAFT_1756657 [Lactarius quietus]|nr:hypothetical protein EI94DRAFT_1756657 [Lactarius quietus]
MHSHPSHLCPPEFHISHICHRWRDIALNQTVLWSHVYFNALSSAGMTEVLARAKSVPLYLEATRVSWRCWDEVQLSTLQTELEARVPHIRHLSITANYCHLRSTLGGLVLPAPTLEYLSLSSRGMPCASNRPPWDAISIPDNLFDGSTLRLSCLKLRNCDISWMSSLLNGLKYLEILTPSQHSRPELAVWLDTLNEMPQLNALTLDSASPIAPPFPFDVKRTVTLPSLTHLDISASEGDCALALAHLDLPTLTCLCLTIIIPYDRPNGSGVQGVLVLPYIVQHAHGPQDIQPLQSMVIRDNKGYLSILAWTLPDIDVEMHDRHAFLGATLPTRVALSFKGDKCAHLEILDTVMAGLPLDGLVMLSAEDITSHQVVKGLSTQQFWLRHSPRWPLLRRVRLTCFVLHGFTDMLLEDNGGRDGLLLPSMTELVLARRQLDADLTRYLCDALMKRVEEGVPLELIDLRMNYPLYSDYPAATQLLSEIVVDETRDTWNELITMWHALARGPFLEDYHSDEEDYEE